MVDVVLGGFLGDEGKVKVMEYLSKDADIVVRYTGGSNAGHNVRINDRTYNFRMLSTAIFQNNITVVIGNGVAVNPKILLNEIKLLKDNGIPVNNLKISEKAHVILPYHIELDKMLEENRGTDKIGTTLCGVGPAYCDKYERSGIRMQDFVSQKFEKLLKRNIENKNKILESYGREPVNYDKIFEEYSNIAKELSCYVCDTVAYLQESVRSNKKIICEGTQATLLDIDFGTYPYVTSSNSTIGGVLTGTGLNHKQIGEVYGVIKAYSSRDGEGPFLTEEDEKIGDKIRELGHEFSSVTKQSRRCGWLDLNALKYAVQINGITALAVNHLDVIGRLDKVKLCVAYQYDKKITTKFSSNPAYLDKCTPVYEEFEGNFGDLSEADAREDLCEADQKYLNRIEEVVGVPIKFIGVGTENENILFK